MSSQTTPVKFYYAVGAALMILLVLTVYLASIDMGALNVVVALAIAVSKALLVILIFMQLRHASPITKAVVIAGFIWLSILFLLTMSDFLTRS